MTVSASEFPPRTIAATPATGPDDEAPDLHDEVLALARSLPGELRRLTVRSGDRAIEVEWAAEARPAGSPVPLPPAQGTPDGRDVQPAAPPDPAVEVAPTVRSPLVGTFYAAPSPGAAPFVGVGDAIDPGQTLGIVEAMKLMNPILADEPGVVTQILVADTESVEYDQVLVHLRPTGRPR